MLSGVPGTPSAAQTPVQSSGGAVQAGVSATLVLDSVVFESSIMLSTWFSDYAVRSHAGPAVVRL